MEAKLAEILEAHNLPTIFSYRRACEAGIITGTVEGKYDGRREVVEWIKEHPQKDSVNGFGTTAGYNFYFGRYDWQAKLKEWNIKLP